MSKAGTAVARGQAARTMVAEDATWVAEAFLSSRDSPLRGLTAFAFAGFAARVVYEGSAMLRSRDPHVGIPKLAAQIAGQGQEIVGRARHASKLLDDRQKSFELLGDELLTFMNAQRSQFLGNAVPFARWLESDVGIYTVRSRLIAATATAQFRLGLSAGLPVGEAGQAAYDVAHSQGSTLALLGMSDGSEFRPEVNKNYINLSDVDSFVVRSAKRIKRMYSSLGEPAAIMLLLVESEVGAAAELLPLAEENHRDSVFRARMVSLFHCLRAIRDVLVRNPDAGGPVVERLKRVLDDPVAVRILSDQSFERLRDRCMHYEIRDPRFDPDHNRPMFGIVEYLLPGSSFEEVERDTRRLVVDFADAFGDTRKWYAGPLSRVSTL